MQNSKVTVFTWLLLYLLFAGIGYLVGFNAIIPGPTSYQALVNNPGEKLAIEANLAPTDGVLILISKNEDVDDKEFDRASQDLISRLQLLKVSNKKETLFSLIQSSQDTFSLDNSKFKSQDGKTRLIIAQGRLPVYESSKEFLEVPNVLSNWNQKYPNFSYGYLSNATGENEVYQLIQRDLDHSLLYTTPLTFVILVWAFKSVLAAFIPLFIAGVSLAGSLGISAILSHLVDGISVTSSQLVVLLVLAIGIDYSLFFLTRAREEYALGLSEEDAIKKTQKTTGHAIFWSGIIVSISLLGLFVIQDVILNSMAIVAIVSVLMTLFSCLLVLPKILLILKQTLYIKGKGKRSTSSLSSVLNLSVNFPKLVIFFLGSFLLFFAYFSGSLNLGNTMLPHVLPQSLQGMATFETLKKEFPHLAGGDLSLILKSESLDQLEENGDLELAFDQLNELGIKGPFKIERSGDNTLARYKFLLKGYGENKQSKEFVRNLRDKILPEIFSSYQVESYLSGVVEHSVREADRYQLRLPILISTVLALSFVFLLFAFKSLVIPIKAIILNLLSTLASFGVLMLVFQEWETGPFYIGVIESFVPPLLFTILFGISMDYHVFMISRISEEYYKSFNVIEAVRLGINKSSRTITSAALIMISVFFVAATLELPVMRQLGFGLGAAILIDATLIRAMLLPASMILLGHLNWYLPKIVNKKVKVKH